MPAATPLDLLADARRAILLALKQEGEATADYLAERAFLSIGAVRLHLAALTTQGLITYRREAHKAGRPAHIYRLTEAGEALFGESAYATLANSILAALELRPELKAEILGALFKRQSESMRQMVRGQTVADRARSLTAALDRQGYFPLLVESPEGFRLRLRHCPIMRVAVEHQQFCEMERAIFMSAIGATASQVEDRKSGDATCAYLLTFKRDAAAGEHE